MTPEERRACGKAYAAYHDENGGAGDAGDIFAAGYRAALAAERERCARVAESLPFESWEMDDLTRKRIARRIREGT